MFRKKIEKCCRYCTYCTKLDEGQMLCKKQGVVTDDYSCRKFRYDPFKRIPLKAKAPDFEKYDEDDFSL